MLRVLPSAIPAIIAYLLLHALPVHADETLWRAGSAAISITPAEPMWMAGYASRNKPSEGIASELYAKAFVVEDFAGQAGVIITLDLISVPRKLRDRVAERIAEQHGIPASAVLLNCSHTHCGPELRFPDSPVEELSAERVQQAVAYSQRLEEQLIQLVGTAKAATKPSKLTYHRARAGFAMNRRLPSESGYQNSPNPASPVDHDVPVLKVETADGQLATLLFGYACHNTTLSFYNLCGDYAGFAQQELEQAHPGTIAMFVMGCGGDQNPYPRGSLDLAKKHGVTLATAVDAALQTPAIPVTGNLSVTLTPVAVAYAEPPSLTEIESRMTSSNTYIAKHARRLKTALETTGKLPTEYSTLIQTFQFGDDLTLIALPGETVVDYSLRLKRELTDRNVWVAGYSNDVFAYVPSRRVLEEGGYEGGGALVYFTSLLHPGPFATDIEDRILKAVHESQP